MVGDPTSLGWCEVSYRHRSLPYIVRSKESIVMHMLFVGVSPHPPWLGLSPGHCGGPSTLCGFPNGCVYKLTRRDVAANGESLMVRALPLNVCARVWCVA